MNDEIPSAFNSALMAEPATAAEELREALAEVGSTRVYQADENGISVLSVWANLTVWCIGGQYVWREGYDFQNRASHPVRDPAGAAMKIRTRYEHLRDRPDLFQPT